MQQQNSPVASQELADDVQAPATGPVVLDLAQQALVSGGAPKGGWVPPVSNAESEAQGNW
jgi:hypothetical protein